MDMLDEIIGHLGAARNQRASCDDKIIAGHIDAAYEAASNLKVAERGLPHGPQCGCHNCT